jgi:hypothetical protein
MSDTIIVALIGFCGSLFVGALGFLGVVISSKKSEQKLVTKVEQRLITAQAVTDTKIEELTREVREHNNFARRMPVVESEIHHIEEDIKTLQSFHTRGSS